MKKIACRRIRKGLVGYLYGETVGDEEKLVKEHLEVCSFCRETLEGMNAVLKTMEGRAAPERSEGFWESYTERVLDRVRGKKIPSEGTFRYNPGRLLVFSSACAALFLMVVGFRFYMNEKEIAKNPELYNNLEVLRNLDLINDVIGNETFAPEIIRQSSGNDILPDSRKVIYRKLHKFNRLENSEKELIFNNYRQWAGYSVPDKEASRSVYKLLKAVNYPDLK